MPYLRKLNADGMGRFGEWIVAGATGAAPLMLLVDPQTSDTVPALINLDNRLFADRYIFGQHLNTLLSPIDAAGVTHDRGLWSALALYWIDQLCPPDAQGRRNPGKDYRYVLSDDFRHYYRHLVRSPWQLVRDHGPNSRFLLLATTEDNQPLQRHGDVLEQLGARQAVLRSKPIIAEASRLFSDPATGRPRRGVAGRDRGSVRRLALVLQQFDLTFDADSMQGGALSGLLPREFDRWKTGVPETETA
ncbi:MAG: hypothetical protein ABL962_02655 [Fimbriimonadaceae bacterium]